ncbi:hypothetical protein AB4156_30180 [Cupriavidus sp. 2MCAB6]|uniref:hypothetical protein n=1 Tax=Cupriavidus sp. 2MCAB6 TaxID=3232981 RepID=UPI003F9117DD
MVRINHINTRNEKHGDDNVLNEAKVNKLSFDFQEGGTVFVNFRVQAHPDKKTTARILQLLGQEVKLGAISLRCEYFVNGSCDRTHLFG